MATRKRRQSLSRFNGCAAVRVNKYERLEVIGSSGTCAKLQQARTSVPHNI